MNTHKKAAEAASVEDLHELKAEADLRFTDLHKQIEEVSDRVADIEAGAGTTRPKKQASLQSAADDASNLIEGEASEGGCPKTSDKQAKEQEATSLWDAGSGEANYHACSPRQSISKRKSCTLVGQAQIASHLSWPIRFLGLSIAFLTVICIWEFTDLCVKKFSLHKDMQLVSYLAITVLAAASVSISHSGVRNPDASLVPAFAYALSTLFLVIGSWGVVDKTVNVLVSEKMKLFAYGVGGLIMLFFTVAYVVQTRHNVLLDIASCATTMGLNDDEADDN